MQNRTKFGLIGAFVVHLLILWIVLPHSQKPPPPPPDDIQVVLVDDSIGDIKDSIFNGQGEPCSTVNDTYVGIGIEYMVRGTEAGLTFTVTRAPEHLPAYTAGIRVGDQLGEYLFRQNLKLGVPVVLNVWHLGVKHTYKIMPARICYANGEEHETTR